MVASPTMPLSQLGIQSKIVSLVLLLMLLTLWLALHGYHGLTGDAQIYAFQAFARLHPNLSSDLYLRNTSQDQFTLFSPFYAWCINFVGIEQAARSLALIFTLWLLLAMWLFARVVNNQHCAWLTVAFLLIIGGDFGASHAFRIMDPYLTARLPCEALIITAFTCHARGSKRLGIGLASAALFIHPLMALPGLLVLICLWAPMRVGLIAATLGVLVSLVAAVAATNLPAISSWLTVMDAPWVEVVQERSQFLFPQLWSFRDWCISALPLLTLGFAVIASKNELLRKLCASALLVATTGLVVSLIGGVIGPVAILVQGQAWRWVWISVVLSAALVPSTVMQLWRDQESGKVCATLLLSGWILPGVSGAACVAMAAILWCVRNRISSRLRTIFKLSALATVVVLTLLTVTKYWVGPPQPMSPPAGLLWWATQPEQKFVLQVLAMIVVATLSFVIGRSRTNWAPFLLSSALIACSIALAPQAFKQARILASTTDIQEFADWEAIVPSTSTVYVSPPRDVGAFVWFTLGRPNYLALDQSAGVVFSRKTALEIKRRSDVLLTLIDPDWRLLTRLRNRSNGVTINPGTNSKPLTPQSLILICADASLGFVISKVRFGGFGLINHRHAGAWDDWNLYDCKKARLVSSAI